jgi:plastocyanin
MNTLNFIGFLIIIITLFLLYNASETGPFIFKNNQVHNIIINREFFEPNDITIDLGDEVIWKSHDYVLRHTVVNDNPLIRNSDILLKGDEFNIIFDTPGDYVFYSSLYPNFEKGIVRVRNVKSGNKFRRELKKIY